MNSENRINVTASGTSEPQRSAGVSGTGLTVGPNVAGSPRSSPCNREGTGVVNQAPDTLYASGEGKQNLSEKIEKLREEDLRLTAEIDAIERQVDEISEKDIARHGEDRKLKSFLADSRECLRVAQYRKYRVEIEILQCEVSLAMDKSEGAAARLGSLVDFVAAYLWCPPEEYEGYLARTHVLSLALSDAVKEFRTEQNNQPSNIEAELEDEGFRMPRKEASLNLGKPSAKRKALGSPLSDDGSPLLHKSLEMFSDVQLDSDDAALGVGIQLAMTQAKRLASEVETAHEKGEVRDHIAGTVSELFGTVNAVNDLWAVRTPRKPRDPPPEATQHVSELREMQLEVTKMEEVIAKSKGKGVSKVIQDATKQLRVLLKKASEKKETIVQPTPSTSQVIENEEKKRSNQPPEDREVPEDKKKRVKNKKKKEKTEATRQQGKRKLPPMPQGIVIKATPEGGSYADITKKLTAGVDLAAIGVSITSMKRTREGQIVLTVGKGEEATKLKAEAEKVLGADAVIRESARPILMEVLGVGCFDIAEDVISGICRDGINKEDVVVRRLVPSFGGAQRAIVQVTGSVATQLMKKGTVRIGFLSCRVRLREQKTERCFRCHGYGHKAAGCKGPDRSNQCMTCGGVGHLAKECKAPPHCVLCEAMERSADHYPGSGKCEAYRVAMKKMKK